MAMHSKGEWPWRPLRVLANKYENEIAKFRIVHAQKN